MKRHHLIIIAILLIYVLSTVYVVHTLFFKAKPMKASNKLAVKTPDIPEAQAPIDTPVVPKVLTKVEIEKAKHDFLSGRKPMPPELNISEADVLDEYFYGCSQIVAAGQRIRCFDFYYDNHDDNYIQSKKDCGSDTICLDSAYYEMAKTTQDTYCEAITDEATREECIKTIV